MDEFDTRLEQRIRDIVAVVTEDIDAISVEVEDGVAYIEGVVPTQEQRRTIVSAVRGIRDLRRVISCLAVERVLPRRKKASTLALPAPILMHYFSLS